MKTTKKTEDVLTSACRRLRAALMEDLALSRELLANMRAQQLALMANDHYRVADIEAQGQTIAERQEANILPRETAIRAVAMGCGISCEDGEPLPRLANLASKLPEAEAKALRSIRASLLEAEHGLKELNEQNRTLVRNALDIVHFTFHAITDLAMKPAGYGAGKGYSKAPAFYLDHRA